MFGPGACTQVCPCLAKQAQGAGLARFTDGLAGNYARVRALVFLQLVGVVRLRRGAKWCPEDISPFDILSHGLRGFVLPCGDSVGGLWCHGGGSFRGDASRFVRALTCVIVPCWFWRALPVSNSSAPKDQA